MVEFRRCLSDPTRRFSRNRKRAKIKDFNALFGRRLSIFFVESKEGPKSVNMEKERNLHFIEFRDMELL